MLFVEKILFSPTRHKNILDLCFTNFVIINDKVDTSPNILLEHNIIDLTMHDPELTKYKLRAVSAETPSDPNLYKAGRTSLEN